MNFLKFLILISVILLSNCKSQNVLGPCQIGSETFNLFAISRVATNDSSPYCNIKFSNGINSQVNSSNPSPNPSPTPSPNSTPNPNSNSNSFSEIEVFDAATKINSGFTKTYPGIISSGNLASKKTFHFTIKNTGNTVLNISSINITGSGFYTIISTVITSIAANSESIISIRYEPTLIGTHLGTLTINSDSRTNPSFTISLTGSGNSFPQTINLQVYYKFNNNALDSSGNPTRNGNVIGTLNYVADRFGNPNSAGTTNGSVSNWLIVPSVPIFSGGDTNTFAYWVRFNSNSGTLLERRNGTANNYEITHHIDATGVKGLHGKNTTPGWSNTSVGVGTASISHVPDLQKYYHVVFVKNNNLTAIYIDGILRANGDINNPSNITTAGANGNGLFLFYNSSGGGFVGPLLGAMDSFMYFDTALSAAQVQQLFEQDLE